MDVIVRPKQPRRFLVEECQAGTPEHIGALNIRDGDKTQPVRIVREILRDDLVDELTQEGFRAQAASFDAAMRAAKPKRTETEE